MKHSLTRIMAIFAAVTLMAPTVSFAQSADLAALQNQVKQLTRKVAKLEMNKASAPSYVMPTEGDGTGLIHTPQDITMGGYVETRYTAHVDQEPLYSSTAGCPGNSGVPCGVNGRIFDGQEGFTMNQAKIFFEKLAPEDGGAGFRIDILAGEDARVIDFDPTTDGDHFAFQQAYIEINAPFIGGDLFSDAINIKLGRFTTLAGMEVIEPADNWNISRSFAFGFSLPFTHTGARTNFQMFDGALDVYLGLNNGWDNGFSNQNGTRTLEGALGYDFTEDLSYFTAVYFGGERSGTAQNRNRFLWTHVLSYDVSEALSLALNFDFGEEQGRAAGGGAAKWQAVSAYARYQINEEWSAAYRLEWFHDEDRFRGVTGMNDTFVGNTFTIEHTPYENLILRAEARIDTFNSGYGDVFGGDSNRTSFSGQAIYLI